MEDLSQNNIKSLPLELTSLPSLKELSLSGNLIEKIEPGFASNQNFCQSLCLLDLSNNQIKFLPSFMTKFKSLVTLRVGTNPIQYFPSGLLTAKLRVLDLENLKELKTLPSSASKVYLDKLYVTESSKFMEFNFATCCQIVHNTLKHVATLEDIVCKAIMSGNLQGIFRSQITEESVPQHLIQKMDSIQHCICGNLCLNSSHAAAFSRIDLRKMAASVHADLPMHSYHASVTCVYCSRQCLKRFNKNG